MPRVTKTGPHEVPDLNNKKIKVSDTEGPFTLHEQELNRQNMVGSNPEWAMKDSYLNPGNKVKLHRSKGYKGLSAASSSKEGSPSKKEKSSEKKGFFTLMKAHKETALSRRKHSSAHEQNKEIPSQLRLASSASTTTIVTILSAVSTVDEEQNQRVQSSGKRRYDNPEFKAGDDPGAKDQQAAVPGRPR
jgi:hypothetical protein